MTKKISRIIATGLNGLVLLPLTLVTPMLLVYAFLEPEYWPEYRGWLAIALALAVYPAVNLLALVLPATSWATSKRGQVTEKISRIVAIGLNVVVLVFLAGHTAQTLGGGFDPGEWNGIVQALVVAVYPAVNLLAVLLPDTP